jgi:hypothetical protein
MAYFAARRAGQIVTLAAIPTLGATEPVEPSDAGVSEFLAVHGAPTEFGYVGDPPLPQTATAGNFMRALIELGWYDDIDAAVTALPGQQGQIARALWGRAVEFPRNDPLLTQIAAAVGMTEADIDAVYVRANSY